MRLRLFLLTLIGFTSLCAQIRVNVGGPQYTDTSGNIWTADNGCTSTSEYTYQGTITGTPNPTLYQTGRTSTSTLNCTYAVPVNAYYIVTLKFAEYNRQYANNVPANQRLMNIAINNVRYYTAYNVYATCGFAAACDLSPNPIPVNSSSTGQISITITQQQGQPMLAALEIDTLNLPLGFLTLSGVPQVGQVPTATSDTTADWQFPIYPQLYPQLFGAVADGRTLTCGAMAFNSASLTCTGAGFTNADIGKYISVANAGTHTTFPSTYYGGLGTTIIGVNGSNSVTLNTVCQNTGGVSSATVTYGTDNYAALVNLASAASTIGNKSVIFPPGMYVIGRHKTTSNSWSDPSHDILWTGLSGVTIDGNGSIIYVDGSYNQANDSSGHSNENTITPFYIQGSDNLTIQNFTILLNNANTTRVSGVVGECLTCFGIALSSAPPSATAVNINTTIRNVTTTQSITDCYEVGNHSLGNDVNITVENSSCDEPGRGNLAAANVTGLLLSNFHGGNSGASPYGGYEPFFCVDIEPNLTADNVVMNNKSTCKNDRGWEFTVSNPTKVGHVTIRDSEFSWTNSNKEQGFNASANYSLIDNNYFGVGHLSTAFALKRINSSATSQIWQNNIIVDTTNSFLGGTIIDEDFEADGTLIPVTFTHNTIYLNGMVCQCRNNQQWVFNTIYYTATGSETGTNNIVNLEGTQSAHDNNYNTNLAADLIQVFYGSTYQIPVIANEHYLNPTFFSDACSYCVASPATNNTTLVNLQPSANTNLIINGTFTTSTPWTFLTGWAFSTGFAVGTNVPSTNQVLQPAVGVVTGREYLFTYTVSGNSGSGSANSFLGSAVGIAHNANGTFTDVLKAPAGSINVGIAGNAGYTGSISNISLVPANPVYNIGASALFTGTVPTSCSGLPNGTITSFGGALVLCPSGVLVSSFNTRTGAVTLTSGDVTTALGFTPATKAATTASGNASISTVTTCTSSAVPSGGGTPTITCGSVSIDAGHTHVQQ